MTSVEQASELILSRLLRLKNEHINLEDATGRVLARDVNADRNFPPFDRVTMDGIAISYASYQRGLRSFSVEGIQYAGEPARSLQNPNGALEVMTGAVLPHGCDTVVPYEDINLNAGVAEVTVDEIREAQNVHAEGRDQKKGAPLLQAGTLIGPSEVAVLATVGVSIPRVFCLPRVAVVATGDELVPVDKHPEPYQIRSSNSQALASALRQWGITANTRHITDDKSVLTDRLGELLADNDVLLLSGGVSKGKADYLPEVLASLGVINVFHRIAQKPGKPFWFGHLDEKKFVFAFPGNPISTFMCYRRYFVPWLRACLSLPAEQFFARLSEDFTFGQSLTYFLQVKTRLDENGVLWAQPRSGGGSGDLANLIFSDGFLELPASSSLFKKGEALPFYPYRPL